MMTRFFRGAIFIALIFSANSAFAANWYVSKSATGSNNGTSWTNAWNEMSQINWSSVACGDTIWFAGGNYTTTLTLTKSCTSSTPVTIDRVLATDSVPTAAAGWNSSFDSAVNINTAPGVFVTLGSSWITMDGRIDGRTGNGIVINTPSDGGTGFQLDQSSAATYSGLTFKNFKAIGGSCTLAGSCGGGSDGFWFSYTGTILDQMTISNCDVESYTEIFHTRGWQNTILQYCNIHDTGPGTSTEHIDIAYTNPWSSTGSVIWRYNTFWNSANDGIFFEGGGISNWYFYGNVFYASGNLMITLKSPGSYGPIFIYNNLFASNTGPCSSSCASLLGVSDTLTGVQIYNNVFYNVSNSIGGQSGVVSDYNAYSYTSLNGFAWDSSEAHSFTFTANAPFVNPSNTFPADWHELSTSVLRGKGLALAPDGFINFDMDGNQRNASSTPWDIGAYQYSTGSTSQAPQPPTGLSATAQ